MKPIFQKRFELHALILAAIVVLAAGIRLWGIDFGLPFLYHPDEWIKIEVAVEMLQQRDINPHFFTYPPFYFYLNVLLYLLYIAASRLSGSPLGVWDLEPPIMLNMATGYLPQSDLLLIGRLFSLLFDCLSLVVIYFLAVRVFENRPAGLLAALFAALSPGLIPHSRYMTPDSIGVFFCLLTAYSAMNVYQRGRPVDYLLAAVCGTLAASIKYTLVLALVLPAAAHLLRNGLPGSFQNRRIWISVLAAPLIFLLLNPVILTAFPEFYQGAVYEATHYAAGHEGMEGDSLRWYLQYFWSLEGWTAVVGLAGMLYAVFQREKKRILLAVFPAVYFIFISAYTVHNDRTAIPITPFLYLFGAALLVRLYQLRPHVAWQNTLIKLGSAALALFLLASSTLLIVNISQRMARIDSRETARVWIEKTIPPGAKIALERYAPYVDPQRYQVVGIGRLIDEPPGWYQENEIAYLIASQGSYQRYFVQPELYAEQVAAYNAIFSSFAPAQIFTDGGYEVRVYRVR